MKSEFGLDLQVDRRRWGTAELPDPQPEANGTVLGEPLSIGKVARLIGCSVWSIRQRLILQGLPHFRCSKPSGKLIFYRDQVIRWILEQQKKKGGE
jgi:hypothetical protein